MSWSPPSRPPSKLELACYQAARFILVGLSRVLFPGRVYGRQNLPKSGAYLVVPVHRSYIDWLIVARITRRRLRYIVKEEVWKSKFVGRALEVLGCFPVHRSGADREALDRCRTVLLGGEPLVMFPEGTRRSGPIVEDLREGAAYLAQRTGLPVVPIGIGGSEKAMPKGASFPKPGLIHVVIGKPIYPADASPQAPRPSGARVSRKATRALSDLIGTKIQDVFDEADHIAKVR